jgi:hypothetical protein
MKEQKIICDCEMVNTTRKIRVGNKSYDSNSNLYKVYIGIRYRCNIKNKDSKIKYRSDVKLISKEWAENYLKFIEDMGERPSLDHSVDRIDNFKGYCKHNCRWATPFEQSLNRAINTKGNLPLGLTIDLKSKNRIDFRVKYDGNEHHLMTGNVQESIFASYLYQCLIMITGDKKKSANIFIKMKNNEYETFSKYFNNREENYL